MTTSMNVQGSSTVFERIDDTSSEEDEVMAYNIERFGDKKIAFSNSISIESKKI